MADAAENGGVDVPFYSFTRDFDIRYVFADAVLVFSYVAWLWRNGWRWCVLRGLVLGAIIYYIDGVVWYNTPLSDELDAPFQRTWDFECENGVSLSRSDDAIDPTSGAEPCALFGVAIDARSAYAILKSTSDWMMTWSYALLWFTWESVVVYLWIEHHDGRRREGSEFGSRAEKTSSPYGTIGRHFLVAFTVHFMVYPLSLLISAGDGIRAVGTRHMHESEDFWMRYALGSNALLLTYNVAVKGHSLSSSIKDTAFCWVMGTFQSFGMVAPLYLFGIRPVFEPSRVFYEVLFLINRGSAEHFLTCDIAISIGRLWEVRRRMVLKTKGGAKSAAVANVYETDELLNMYLSLHYPASGTDEGVAPILHHKNVPLHGLRFPQRVAQLVRNLEPKRTNNRALDVGCAVGGSSFELARTFDHVEAFDFSESFVRMAKRMQSDDDSVKFRVPVESDIHVEVAAVHEEGVDSTVRKKVRFFAGDACKLSDYAEDIGMFDGAILSNLLCRLPDPVDCLEGLSRVMNQGAVVVIVTPFSWLEQFTPRDKWLGGYYDPHQQPVYSKDQLKKTMEELGFVKVHEEQMPLVIREHQRKYQYIISEATGWRKM